ncbi:MAG: biopolymer transporter ExbD [Deltaproteobacteria bacterium]|nr:MAG: biopolymer transporter ExbD [Deltaproteobacteria bacterium]
MGIGIKKDDEEADIIADINVTPFIDIMLVLLIIFMMTSSVSLQSGLDINIPTSSTATKGKKKEGVLVSLDVRGNLFVDGVQSSLQNLKANISKALGVIDSKLVVFEGDKSSSLEKTLEIIDIAKSAGAQKFAIAAKEK